MNDDFPELDSFDNGFTAEKRQGFLPGIDALPDGPYDLLVTGAELKRETKGTRIIFVIYLQVCGGKYDGKRVQWDRWLTSQDGVNFLGNDLCALGFDADRWTPLQGRPFSAELRKAVPRMTGIKFSATRQTKASATGQTNHNLWINGVFGAAGTPTPAAPAAPPPTQPAPASRSWDEDIPF